jgi:Transposase DDE domain group 1
LIRSDSAGATHGFAAACRGSGVGFSLGTAIDARIRDATEVLNTAAAWYPAIDADGAIRDGAWVAEATDLVDLSAWPQGTRLILRKERPHPGAQLRFTDADGHRVTGFITDTADGVVPGQVAGLELRHRQHARVEDRIREAKATGLRNLPFNSFDANAAWLEIIMTATDLVAWAKLIGFTDNPDLARCEIDTFRYRVLHVAARITRSARRTRLAIDTTWRWATAIATAWTRIRAAFT